MSRRKLAVLVAAGLCLAAGCGSGGAASDRSPRPRAGSSSVPRHPSAREERLARAEASDLNIYTSCEEWLRASALAHYVYLADHWPNLGGHQVRRVARTQSLGCQAAPGAPRRPMGTLQAAVDIVVVFRSQSAYEGFLGEGAHVNAEDFARGLFEGLKLQPLTPAPSHRPSPRLQHSLG